MSVSTQSSFRTEVDWDPQSESTSMISFDMTQPGSPSSSSKFFKVCFTDTFSHLLAMLNSKPKLLNHYSSLCIKVGKGFTFLILHYHNKHYHTSFTTSACVCVYLLV